MGLSRNKVAVPEGAAGTPPFWSVKIVREKSRAVETLKSERKTTKGVLMGLDPVVLHLAIDIL